MARTLDCTDQLIVFSSDKYVLVPGHLVIASRNKLLLMVVIIPPTVEVGRTPSLAETTIRSVTKLSQIIVELP